MPLPVGLDSVSSHPLPSPNAAQTPLQHGLKLGTVPAISQRGKIAGRDNLCGQTASAMMARGFGLKANLSDRVLIRQFDQARGATGVDHSTGGGTLPQGIVNMAHWLGLPAKLEPNWTNEEIAGALEKGHAVIVSGDGGMLLPAHERDSWFMGEPTEPHWALLTKATPHGFKIIESGGYLSPGEHRISAPALRDFLRGRDQASEWKAIVDIG